MKNTQYFLVAILMTIQSSALYSEVMPVVQCSFLGKIISLDTIKNKNPIGKKTNARLALKVKIHELTPTKAELFKKEDCGILIGTTYEIIYNGSLKLLIGDSVIGTSEYNGSASCTPDEQGRFESPDAPLLQIKTKK